jgi:hypothetical protein
MNGGCTGPAAAVCWQMDHDTAADLIHILGILEDFLRLAGCEVLDELAAFPTARPLDASTWAHWLADYLGDQVIALRAATRTAAVPADTRPTPTGEPT